ncbi:MAG: MaoC family dehydratase N-terminal domain-containing protein [Chloroflexi bacterium]|nr:MaoC family dehydratase N-terminal domain-containing protein [Chloroflexota bacterium]
MTADSRESLVPPEARAMVGQRLGQPATGEITLKDAQRFAKAVDDLNPLYFDEAAAREAGYRTLIVPPTYLGYVTAQHGTLADLRIDGLYRSGSRGPQLRVKRVMFGGEDWDFLSPAYVGDTITAETRLAGLEEKDGASGPFVLMTTETTYTNQLGEVVARARGRSIAR